MFSHCRGRHVHILECPTVFPEAMVQYSASLPNVGSWALIAGDAVDHSSSFPLWDGVLWMDQLLPQSPKGMESDVDVQGGQHCVNGL